VTGYAPWLNKIPVVCAVCARVDGLEATTIKKVVTRTWVWFLLPLGVLPAALVALVVQTKHTLSLRFCNSCKRRHQWATAVHWLSALSCIALLFVAVAVGLSMESWLAFLGTMFIAVLIAIASSRFETSVSPRFTVFSATCVEVEYPGHGRFVIYPPC
jgi:hypothetical protein